MKQLLLAIAITGLLVYGAGSAINDWFGFTIHFSDQLLSPVENILVFLAVGVVFVTIGFIVAISMVGAVAIGLVAAFVALLMFGVSLFWPIVLFVIVVWLLARGRREQYQPGVR